MKKRRCSCFILIIVVLLMVSATLMITTLLSHTVPKTNEKVSKAKPLMPVTKESMSLVDALGRPLILESQISPRVESESPNDFEAASSSELSPSELNVEESIVSEQEDESREELEAKCLALVLDNSPHAPAEPSALAACRKVLDDMTKRTRGTRKDATSRKQTDTAPLVHSGDDRLSTPGEISSSVTDTHGDGFLMDLPIQAERAAHTAKAPPHTAANLRNEGERCNLMPNHNSPPVLLWRSKRVGGSTLAALLVRYAFIHKLQVAGPQGRMATRACKQAAWRSSVAHPQFNASVSHWPFVCKPHSMGEGWGGLSHLFGGRNTFREVVVVRDPVARAVAVYYWLGRRPVALRRLVGMKDPVVNPTEPPPIVKAMHYAKNLPEAYTGAGGGDLPKWPWHSFSWGAAEAIGMLNDREMIVIVLEHYDESLLALRRVMKWPIAEILYTVKRRGEGLAHATWDQWPPGAIRQLKVTLKKQGAWEFHEAALTRWAKMIAEVYPEGKASFDAELSLFKAASFFLQSRCAEPDLLDTYINNLIDRSKQYKQGSGPGLEYEPSAKKGSEDSAFTFGKAPLSITELCVRHQYCAHVRGKEKKIFGEAGGPLPAMPPPDTAEGMAIDQLRRGDADGIEALTQLFIE